MSPKEIAEKIVNNEALFASIGAKVNSDALDLARAYLELEKEVSLLKQDLDSEKRNHKTFREAAEGYIEKLKKSREGLREAVKFNADLVTWCDDNNQKIILTYGYGVEKAREALKADDELMKECVK